MFLTVKCFVWNTGLLEPLTLYMKTVYSFEPLGINIPTNGSNKPEDLNSVKTLNRFQTF